jgi:hypothetical protein
MDNPDNNPNEPLGHRLRDLINPALDDPRAKSVQTEILNEYFEKMAGQISDVFEQEFSAFFNEVSARSKSRPQIKNPMIVHALTSMNPRNGESNFNPIKKYPVPISTAFTTFSADEIKDMPGWIHLHEVARDMDIAVRMIAITTDETKGSMMPPYLIIDASKTYMEGAIESPLYPNLPDKQPKFDRRGGQGFDL